MSGSAITQSCVAATGSSSRSPRMTACSRVIPWCIASSIRLSITAGPTSSRTGSDPGRAASYSHQASGGIQHQIGDTMAFEANYVHTSGRLEETVHNANLSFNPATGANYPFTDISRRPFPEWGVVLLEFLEGRSEYNAADFTLTRRFGNRWQAMATYTLGKFEDELPVRPQWYRGPDGIIARRDVGFPLAADFGGEPSSSGAFFAG